MTNMTQTTFNEQYNQFTPDVFRDPLFGELRVFIDSNKQCWFLGSEVAIKLGYSNPYDAIARHVRPEHKQDNTLVNLEGIPQRGNPNIVLIHEFGLYALCMRSQLPNAIPFQNWVYQTIQNMRMYGVSMSPQLKTVLEIDEEQLWRIAKQREEENRMLKEQNLNLQQQNKNLLTENRGLGNKVSSLAHHIQTLNNRRQMSQDYFDDKVRALIDLLDEFLDR